MNKYHFPGDSDEEIPKESSAKLIKPFLSFSFKSFNSFKEINQLKPTSFYNKTILNIVMSLICPYENSNLLSYDEIYMLSTFIMQVSDKIEFEFFQLITIDDQDIFTKYILCKKCNRHIISIISLKMTCICIHCFIKKYNKIHSNVKKSKFFILTGFISKNIILQQEKDKIDFEDAESYDISGLSVIPDIPILSDKSIKQLFDIKIFFNNLSIYEIMEYIRMFALPEKIIKELKKDIDYPDKPQQILRFNPKSRLSYK